MDDGRVSRAGSKAQALGASRGCGGSLQALAFGGLLVQVTEAEPVLDVTARVPACESRRVVSIDEGDRAASRRQSLARTPREIEHSNMHTRDGVVSKPDPDFGVDSPEILADDGDPVSPSLQAGERQ